VYVILNGGEEFCFWKMMMLFSLLEIFTIMHGIIFKQQYC
jgi:hypothetical protein